jgi:hypothetical protein
MITYGHQVRIGSVAFIRLRFSPMAGAYEERLVTAVWLGAMIAVVLALRGERIFPRRRYECGHIVFSPMTLPIKIFRAAGLRVCRQHPGVARCLETAPP